VRLLYRCSIIAIWEENKAKRKEKEKDDTVGIGSVEAAALEVRRAEEGKAKALDVKF
jgi:hypothetical protein